MTAPRQVLPGTIYLVTRRCAQRQFLLTPSANSNAIFLYVLAVAARRFGILVHAFCVLSNHFHLVVTDPHARLPAFEQYLNSLVARAVNACLGRWESLWAPSSYSAVALTSSEDVLDKALYVLANPVAAGLVRHAKDWPGIWSDPNWIGGTVTAVRPDAFFSKNGSMPERIALELSVPAGFETLEQFRAAVAEGLVAREEEHASHGRVFVGAARIRAQSPKAQPKTAAPRRNMNPRVAGRDRWKRIEALARLTTFLSEYRAAWRAWTSGVRDVLFPAGTYGLRIVHGVSCHAMT